MVFPTYADLDKRSTERFGRVILGYSALTFAIYLALGIIGALMFGSTVRADFLINMATKEGCISYIIRGSFVPILLFNTPYKFFCLKELTLVMYDEAYNRSLSKNLEANLMDHYKAKDKETYKEKKDDLISSNPYEKITT